MRGYAKDGVVAAIRAAGGEIYAITSEPQSLAYNAQQHWETGFEHVGDPHQEISGQCTDSGWLSLFTNHWGDDFTDRLRWMSHPKGYFQPGVLALSSRERVLYRWRCRPTRANIGGAVARPTAPHVWKRVQAALEESADAPDVRHDDDPVLDAPPVRWPVFVALLLANGWFLRPVPFGQRTGDPVSRRQRNAILRILFFAAAWVAACIVLPLWIVALAVACWAAKVVPGIRMINERFQNVGPDEEPA